MSFLEIQNSTCSPYFKSPNSCLQSKWFVVALAVSSFVFLGTAAFGAIGLLVSQLPQWLAHAVGTIGHSGCLAMLMWGTVLGGACAITTIILCVRRNQDTSSTTNHDPIEQAAVTPPNETFNETTTSDRTEESEMIINLRASIEATNELPPQTSPLMRDVSNGHIDVVTTPFEQTAAIPLEESIELLNAQLINAAMNGRTEEVASLLNRGASIEASDDGLTPLMIAAFQGHVHLVIILVDRKANIEANKNGWTSLMFAAANGHIEVITTLLDRSANLEATNQWRLTPLMVAAAIGQIEAIITLLDRNAKINATNNNGWTPLIYSAINNKVNSVRILLDRGANIEAMDRDGRTAIDHANTTEIRQILENRVQTLNTQLIAAVRNGRMQEVTTLLDRGANLDARDCRGRTAFDRARTDEIRQILLNWRAPQSH